MACLDNVIGIKRICDSDESTSGLYINDLIKIKDADAAITEEYASGIRMIKDKIRFAQSLVINHLRSNMSKLLTKSTMESGQMGVFSEKSIVAAETGKLKGVQYRVKNFPYFRFNINSLSFYSFETKSVNIYIYDLVTGALLDTFVVPAVAGSIASVVVNKGYTSGPRQLNLFICTDSDISFNQANLHKGHCGGCTNSYMNSYGYMMYAEMNAASEKIEVNLSPGQSTGGISFSYSLECAIDAYLCSLGNVVSLPLLYKAAALIMEEVVNSKRQNSAISIHKDDHEALLAKYEAQFEDAMNNVLNSMVVPKDPCFNCNSKMRYVAIAP